MFCSVECPTFLSYYAAVLLITCSYLLRKVNLDEKCRSPVRRCLFYARQQYNVSYVETSSQYYLIKCTIQTIRQWSPLFLWKNKTSVSALFLTRTLVLVLFLEGNHCMNSSFNKHSNVKRNH